MSDLKLMDYFSELARLPLSAEVTNYDSKEIGMGKAFDFVIKSMKKCHKRGGTVWFIGNGGSSSIASHMAIDYTKNGKIRALAFNDPAGLTCLSNDLGFDQVFAHQIKHHASPGDVLVAISSSGNSPNILAATQTAYDLGCAVFTFSGFGADNALRKLGDLNFYVNAKEYGFVEVTHMSMLHAILDIICGYGK